jgi:hypothetical protein
MTRIVSRGPRAYMAAEKFQKPLVPNIADHNRTPISPCITTKKSKAIQTETKTETTRWTETRYLALH